MTKTKRRGLEGKSLDLIITDGSPGLIRAVEMVYHGVPRQRCWAHKGRNVAAKVRRTNQDECLARVKKIYYQQSRKEAIRAYREWATRWKDEEPDAVRCLAEDLDELLTFYLMPEHHWKKARTSNPIERVFREVRRRTRTISCFTNRLSVNRMVYALLTYQNRKWDAKHLPNQTTHRPSRYPRVKSRISEHGW